MGETKSLLDDGGTHAAARPAAGEIMPARPGISPALLQKKLQRRAVQAKPDEKSEEKPAGAVTPLDEFRAALEKKKLSAKEATDAWAKVADKSACDEKTVILAIEKLPAADAWPVARDSGRGLTAGIVDAIVKKGTAGFRDRAWHDQIRHLTEEIVNAPESEPKSRLKAVVHANRTNSELAKYFKGPKLGDEAASQRIVPLENEVKIAISDKDAIDLGKRAPGLEKPSYKWRVTARPEGAFGKEPLPCDASADHSLTMHCALKPEKEGAVELVVEATAYCKEGFLGKAEKSYPMTVMSSKNDPEGYFEARFKEAFKPILAAPPFEKVMEPKEGGAKHPLAALFTPEQRTGLLAWMDTKICPPGLFTNQAKNIASGPMRVLIAGHMLAFGRIKMKEDDVDGAKWCASCCGGWAGGVHAYAGVNFATGYGAASSEVSASPTGEKSYGSGQQDTEHAKDEKGKALGPSGDVIAAKKAEEPWRKEVDEARKALHQAPEGSHEREVAKARLEGAEAAAQPYIDAAEKAKVEQGSSPKGLGNRNMPFEQIEKSVQPGDWLFLDNNGEAGHSVLFVRWVGKPTTQTEKAADVPGVAPRTVWYRKAAILHQPTPEGGGTDGTVDLGFPESRDVGVCGVYAVTHAREDAQVASTPEAFCAINLEAALVANRKIIDDKKTPRDAVRIRDRLKPLVQARIDGLKDHKRFDTKGRVAGGLSDPQAAVCKQILAGTGDVEKDIAYLVAVGQKLAVIDVIQGNPTAADGLLTTKVAAGKNTWDAPFPAWGNDAGLRK